MGEMLKSYYSIMPAEIRYDTDLTPNAKLLYGEITALCNEKGYCWATNEYFADLYKVSERTITEWIKLLQNKGYITTSLDTKRYDDGTIKKIRFIHIEVLLQNHVEVLPQNHIEENFAYNNTKYNNTKENNISKDILSKKVFKKPTIEEIKQYCNERNNGIDAEYFYDFYETKNWYVGKNKVVDWKACVRTWEKNNKNKKSHEEVIYETI